MKKKLGVMTPILGVLVLGMLVGAIMRFNGSAGVVSKPLAEPEVPRFTDQTREAIKAAIAATGRDKNKRSVGADAWEETACNGVAIHIYDRESSEWLWYDLETRKFTQRISALTISRAILRQMDAKPGTWLSRQDQPGARPRYKAAYSMDTGEMVWLHFSTEKCSLLPARLELSVSPDEPGHFMPLRVELDTD